MKWISTRGASPPVSFIDALFAGTAPDGGLYMPERLDPLPPGTVGALPRRQRGHRRHRLDVGAHLLRDEITDVGLNALVRDALEFPIPLVQVTDHAWALELFHGPTLAFKDVGARVQARLLHHFTDGTPLTILVATSGDTGSAVAQAFHGVPDTRVVVLYPEGKVSDVQEAQMASLGDNITAVAVHGTFDDCQRLVKEAFADDDLRTHVWLTPANSINLGRLLPQVFYYFMLARLDRPDVVSVPSGNFGNLTAGLIAKRIGLPVRALRRRHQRQRRRCPQYLQSGHVQARPSIETVANAMDVGAPSNFERMRALYDSTSGAAQRHRRRPRSTMRRVVAEIGERVPAARVPAGSARRHRLAGAAGCARPAIAMRAGVFLATAHPAKFREVVEPAIGAAGSAAAGACRRADRRVTRQSLSMPAEYSALARSRFDHDHADTFRPESGSLPTATRS